jgi:SAM-dependent methyltransferase
LHKESGLGDESYSHVTVNFAMHIVRDPVAAAKGNTSPKMHNTSTALTVQDIKRILKPKGVFAFTVWIEDNPTWVPDLRSCFEALPFEAPLPNPLPMALNGRLEWIRPLSIRNELELLAFRDVEVKSYDHVIHIEDARDFMKMFRPIIDWLVNSTWSEESKTLARPMLHEHIVTYMEKKYDGKGWDVTWSYLSVTCFKP